MRIAFVCSWMLLTMACSSESGGDGTGGTGGGGSDVSCSAWCAHFYDDLQCDPAGEAECVGDCEDKKQSGDFLLAEAQCQLSAPSCTAWDDCGEQF